MKKCSVCQNEKPMESFPRDRRLKSGRKSRCTDCNRAAYKDYYLKNTDKVREVSRRKQRDYVPKNPILFKENQKKWRENNKEARSEYWKKWRAENPDKAWLKNQNRRIRKKSGKITKEEISNFLNNSEYICFYCSRDCRESYHLDHFYPLSKGGEHKISNIVMSCPPCNLRKSDKDPYVFLKELNDGSARNRCSDG